MRLVGVGLLVAAGAVAFAGEARGDTLPEAIDRALATNPAYAIAQADRELADEAVNRARGAWRPSVTVSASGGYESTDTTRVFAFDVGDRPLVTAQIQAVQPIFTSGRISNGVRQARASRTAAENTLEAERQTLILDVVEAYIGVQRDREAVKIGERNVALLTEQVRAARDRFDVGVVTRTDVKLAEARLAGAEARLAGTRAAVEASEASYAVLTGTAPDELTPAPPEPGLPVSLEEVIAEALANNPELLAARANLSAAEAGVGAAKGATGPEVSLVGTASVRQTYEENDIDFGGMTITDSDPRDTSVSALVQARIPLYQGGQLNSDVRSARQRRVQARLGVDNAERTLRAAATQAWFGYQAALTAVEASRAQVEAAEIAYEGALEEQSVGVRSTLDVLQQEQELFDARLARIDADRDAYVNAHRVLQIMGRLELSQ